MILNKYSNYQIINFSFLVVLFFVVFYSLVFGVGNIDYPVSCAFKNIADIECPSCGMSRSFTAALHGHFKLAYCYNNSGVLILFFVLTQIVARVFMLFIESKKRVTSLVVKLDVTLSLLFFTVAFFPLVKNWVSFINRLL